MIATIKGLPLKDLEVTCILCCLGLDDEGRVDFEAEYLNKELSKAATFTGSQDRCACCGHALKYACEVVHVPTKAGYYVGRDCAAKIEALHRFAGTLEHLSVALAERVACAHREAEYRKKYPDAVPALEWALTPNSHKIVKDLRDKIRRWGSISDSQRDLLIKIHAQNIEHRAKATGTCPTGRVEIRGKVISVRDKPDQNEHGRTIHHWKMLVDLGNGVRLYGTCPALIAPRDYSPHNDPIATPGSTVRFCAEVKPKENDPLFGFFSRPTKPAILT